MKFVLIIASVFLGSAAFANSNLAACNAFRWSGSKGGDQTLVENAKLSEVESKFYYDKISERGQSYFVENCKDIKDTDDAIASFGESAAQSCKSKCDFSRTFKSGSGKAPQLVTYCQERCRNIKLSFNDYASGFRAGSGSVDCKKQPPAQSGYKWGVSTDRPNQ